MPVSAPLLDLEISVQCGGMGQTVLSRYTVKTAALVDALHAELGRLGYTSELHSGLIQAPLSKASEGFCEKGIYSMECKSFDETDLLTTFKRLGDGGYNTGAAFVMEPRLQAIRVLFSPNPNRPLSPWVWIRPPRLMTQRPSMSAHRRT